MSKLTLDRRTLASLLQNNQQAIFAFERLLGDVDGVLPSTIEEANALAGQALAVAQIAMLSLSTLAEALEQLEGAPAAPPVVEPEDTAPRAHLGTVASQNADEVEITGGTAAFSAGSVTTPSLRVGTDAGWYSPAVGAVALSIAGTKIASYAAGLIDYAIDTLVAERKSVLFYNNQYGIGTPDFAGLQIFCGAGDTIRFGRRSPTGVFTEVAVLNATDQFLVKQVRPTAVTGTPPLVVASTTKVANLYVEKADKLGNPTTLPAAATDLPTTITLVNALRAAGIAKGL